MLVYAAFHRTSTGEPLSAHLANGGAIQHRSSHSHTRALLLATLAAIPIFYLFTALWWHPTNFFGLTLDDSIYFSSAKALAQGRGYILPSVPGTPVATKYPIFYPWILSFVWRLDSSFPGNLRYAIALTAIFGLGFSFLSFLFLCNLGGLAEWEALILTFFCALHPLILYFSLNVLSDIPFAALMMAAVLLADRAIAPEGRDGTAACSGILTGLSILTRIFGVSIAAGFVAAAIARRRWRPTIVFCLFLAPFCAPVAWHILFPAVQPSPVSPAAAATFGWTNTWAYYTSYIAAWKIGIPNSHIFWDMIRNNALEIPGGIANYFLYPLLIWDSPLGRGFTVAVAAVVLLGCVRQAHRHGWKVIHYVLLFYVAIMMFWNYPVSQRFFLPFLPLFAAGLWYEGRHILRAAFATISASRSGADKIVAAALGLLIVAFGASVTWNCLTGMRSQFTEQSNNRGALLQEKLGAYQWILRNTSPETRVIAFEDTSVYLYTGRLALCPIVFTTAEFYDPTRMGHVVAHMTDVPRAIGAGYWLTADDDYGIGWPNAFTSAHARMAEIERVLPTVYASPGGHVHIYQLGCIQHPEDESCRAAARVLFPEDKIGHLP